MKKLFALLFIIPLFLSCSKDEDLSLPSSKWTGTEYETSYSLTFSDNESILVLTSKALGSLQTQYRYTYVHPIITMTPLIDGRSPIEGKMDDNCKTMTLYNNNTKFRIATLNRSGN